MASKQEKVKELLLDHIQQTVERYGKDEPINPVHLLQVAEAWAWVVRPNQSHGFAPKTD